MKNKILNQLLMLSRYAFYGFLIQTFLYSLLLAEKSSAQKAYSVKEVYISIKFNNEELLNVINKIESKTAFKFSYNIDDLKSIKPVYGNFNGARLYDVLYSISQQAGIKFKQVDENISITRLKSLKHKEIKFIEIIQTRNISGKVTSFEDEEGLPGVNVLEKGTSNGIVTNVDGEYTIEVSESATLVFSSVGYTTEEVEIGNRSVINLTMTPDIQQLQELVVIGYGTMKKSDLTGSVSSISTEELSSIPVSSVEQMLQGRAAGVQITSSSGGPGAASSIKIRGVNSINSSSEPLYVIDGVPIAANSSGNISASGTASNTGYSILSTINPGDIESIEILKDASSTAIYGSRGANGVVLITTKKGRSGQSQIELNANYGISNIPFQYEVLNAEDYKTRFHEYAAQTGNEDVNFDDFYLEDNNWIDEVTRTGITQNYQLSVNGGDEKTKYYLSGSYFDDQGVLKESFLRRYTARINAEHKPVNIVTLGTNITYSRSEHQLVDDEGTIHEALTFGPIIPKTDPDGPILYPSYEYIGQGQLWSFNPLGRIYGQDRENFNDRMLLNGYGNIEITNDLSFKSTIGIDLINAMDQSYRSHRAVEGFKELGRAEVSQRRTSSLTNTNQLTYQKTFAGIHDLTATLIQETTKASTQILVNNWDIFPTDALSFYGIGSGTQKAGIANNKREWTMLSFATRLNYVFNSKYMLTFTARRDGSSRFGEDNKWGFFPSGAFAWRASEEAFMNGIDKISNLKFRASYGKTGNTDIGLFNSIVTIGTAGYSSIDQEIPVYFPQRIANKELKWETTTQTNIGFDLGLFSNRINLTADYFNSVTTDLLLAVNIPENAGFSSVLKNVGTVKNNGIELTLDGFITQGEFQWNMTGTFSRSINKVTDLGGEHQIRVGGQRIIVGQPLQNQYGVNQIGIFQTEEEILTTPNRSADEPGVPIYEDVNKDGKIDGNDEIILGRGFPDFYYGLTSNMEYRNFDLFIYFSGVQGYQIFNNTKFNLANNSSQNTLQEYFDNRWTSDNPSQHYPRTWSQHMSRSSEFLEDGSFLRLKAVTLGYNLPVSNLGWISRARLFITAQNLFTITNYSGYDPEVNENGQSNVAPPEDNGAYPRARTFSLGANFNF